ncbi:cupin domain-containing protein [Xanthomonas sp. Kuri4-1]
MTVSASPAAPRAIPLLGSFARIDAPWSPRVIAALNDYHFKLVRVQGEFVWHRHPDTDEAFLVLEGELRIGLRDGEVRVRAGELYVVPRGVEHRPCADAEVKLLLIEPCGVPNTGDAGGERTAPADRWL